MTRGIPRASVPDNVRFALTYTLPNALRGTFISVPFWMTLTTRLDCNRWASGLMADLQDRYGGRAVVVHAVTGPTLLLLSPEDIRRVLQSPADLYSLDSPEKHAGLEVFQPDSLILSRGEQRAGRRRFNEAVLDTGQQAHRALADRFLAVLREEITAMLPGGGSVLGRPDLEPGFRRVMRRCVFGDAAADDEMISDMLNALRADANWLGYKLWARRRDARIRALLDTRIGKYVKAAEPGSLVSMFGSAPQGAGTLPAGQITHWMMAFDAVRVGITQTLALLAVHEAERERALAEIAATDARYGPQDVAAVAALEYVRACFTEGIRLWAPVPSLMRVTTADTSWYGATLPAGTGVLIPSILHHRERGLPHADAFAPQTWLDGSASQNWWIAPFARGEGQCPGRDLGLFLGTAGVAEMLRQRRFDLLEPRLRADRPLPRTINPQAVRFAVREVARAGRPVPPPSRDSGSRPDRTVPSDPAVAGG